MMRRPAWLIFVGLSVVGCHRSGEVHDSNSNWLVRCEAASDCEVGDCICGVCTDSCKRASDCALVKGREAVCLDPATRGVASGCAEQNDVASICLFACVDDVDCDRGFRCLQGACVDTAQLTEVGREDGPCDTTGECKGELLCAEALVCVVPEDVARDAGAMDPVGPEPVQPSDPVEPQPRCGDGVRDVDEECDGDCPTTCDDADLCTEDRLLGAARTCDARCENAPIKGCKVLVTGEPAPSALVTDDDNLYWTNAGTRDSLGNHDQNGQVRRMPLPGGAPVTLVDGLTWTGRLVLDGGDLYFLTARSNNRQAINRTPVSAGDLSVLSERPGVVEGLAVRGNTLFWTEASSLQGQAGQDQGEVWSMPKDASAEPTSLLSMDMNVTYVSDLLVFDESLYFFSYEGLWQMQLDGTGLTKLTEVGDLVAGFASDATSLYWATAPGGGIWLDRFEPSADRTTRLADVDQGLNPNGLAVDDTHIYLMQQPEEEAGLASALQRYPKTPGDTEVLMTTPLDGARGGAIALHGDFVYFVLGDAIVRLPKP